MMKLLISFALLAVAVQCDAQKWLDTITKPNGVFQNPLSSISNGFKKGIDAPAASTEGTTSASGATRSSSSSTAGGANPVGSGGMTNLFGFATNFNKNVTNGIGNFIKSPLSAMTNISNSIRDSIGGGINRTIESTTNMSMAVRDALTNSTGTLSDLGKNFAGMAGDAAFTRRELRALIGPSLRNSTGSLKDAVKKLVEAIDGGDSFGLLWAAGPVAFEILGQLVSRQIDPTDAMAKLQDLGSAVFSSLRRNFMIGVAQSFMPGFGANNPISSLFGAKLR